MSTMPLDHHQVSLIDIANENGADYVERFMSFMLDLGLVEPAMDGSDVVMVPTKDFCRFFNLDSIGVGVQNGEWIRFDSVDE